VIVGIIRRKPVLSHASIVFGSMLASVNSVNLVNVGYKCRADSMGWRVSRVSKVRVRLGLIVSIMVRVSSSNQHLGYCRTLSLQLTRCHTSFPILFAYPHFTHNCFSLWWRWALISPESGWSGAQSDGRCVCLC